jgi:hypothetical protein
LSYRRTATSGPRREGELRPTRAPTCSNRATASTQTTVPPARPVSHTPPLGVTPTGSGRTERRDLHRRRCAETGVRCSRTRVLCHSNDRAPDVSDRRRWRMSNGAANSRACPDRCRKRVRPPSSPTGGASPPGSMSTPPSHDTGNPRWRGSHRRVRPARAGPRTCARVDTHLMPMHPGGGDCRINLAGEAVTKIDQRWPRMYRRTSASAVVCVPLSGGLRGSIRPHVWYCPGGDRGSQAI